MNEITAMALPEQDSTRSLQDRLRDLRSRVQPEKGLDEAKLKKACQDFEAVFIGQIWKQMRASVPKEGLLNSKEQESYMSMFDQEISLKMARSGGIGLSDMLYANLSDRLLNASRDATSAAPLNPLGRDQGGPQTLGQAPAVQPRTLAAIAAQHEAEMLARRIEQSHAPSVASKGGVMPTDLDDALRVVRLDGEEQP